MKRDHSYHHHTNQESDSSSTMWSGGAAASCGGSGEGEVDDLFAALGYKLRQCEMADVAQKIDQLEQAMEQQGGAAESTVHYNPSDLSSWLESMITGLNPDQEPYHQPDPSSYCGSDLFSIAGKAAIPSPPQKKLKTADEETNTSIPAGDQARPLVIADSQQNGITLVHSLMACAEAVQGQDFTLAEALVKKIGFLAASQVGPMRKVATYFAEALARRIYKLYPAVNPQDLAFDDVLEMHFYESCPYLKFAHFTANQAILEALAGKSKVHVIDFGIKQGMQWPALMQALAFRPNGPPSFRLTGIGPPSHDSTDYLQQVGWKLAELAQKINIEFKFRGLVASSLVDLHESMLDIREGEAVCVNSIFELHQTLARPGGADKVLGVVRALRPEIVTVVEQEANHNGPVFLDRFNEALHYYSTVFDSLESCGGGGGGSNSMITDASERDRLMSEVYLGRQICNVVACDGVDRFERHEALEQWRARFGSSGFVPVHLGSNAYKQASMLLALYAGGDGYRVEENGGCLMLGWHTRPLIATSAWRMGG